MEPFLAITIRPCLEGVRMMHAWANITGLHVTHIHRGRRLVIDVRRYGQEGRPGAGTSELA